MNSMRILCISDLHGDFETLKKIVDITGDIDAIVVAGDFTNFSSARVALQMIEELKSRVQSLFIVPGNCEISETSDLYENLGISLHGFGRVIGDVGFFGVGGSNTTPFNTPLEYEEEEIREMLERGFGFVKDSKVKILISHPPPFETVDRTSSGVHAGSRAVKDFLNENKVDIVLCGHIHEAKGRFDLKQTKIVNTGPACYGYVVVNINMGEEATIEFMEL